MKRCPECRKDYFDDSLVYCLDDGAFLTQGTVPDEPATAVLLGERVYDEGLTRRLQTAGERPSRSLTFSVPAILAGPRLPWVIAALALVAAAVFGYSYFVRPVSKAQVMRLSFEPPPDLSFNDVQPDFAVISPDGQKIAFSATADGKNMLYVRELDSAEAKLLQGSDNPLEPFWSPDSSAVAYGSNGKLKRSDLSGGTAQVICDAARIVGGSWSKDGTIVFTPDYRKPLAQVPATGGDPQPVPISDPEGEEPRHRYPYFLPDGRHFLFQREEKGIYLGSLDSPENKQIVPDGSAAIYSKQGYLLFLRNNTLVAQEFDSTGLNIEGEAQPILEEENGTNNSFLFSASDNGVLLWQGMWNRDYQLIWYDRQGKEVGTVEPPTEVGVGMDPHLSPDGRKLVIKRNPPNTLWVIDLERGSSVRITSDFGQIPVWSPDGNRIAYAGIQGLVTKAASGLGEPEVVLASLSSGAVFPYSWSPDGRFIVYVKRGVKTRLDLYAVEVKGDKREIPLLNSTFDERSPALSPDGKWLAYDADDTGRPEIYVQQFSPEGNGTPDRKLVSTGGGRMAVWRRDGKELFFIANDGMLTAVDVRANGEVIEFSDPRPLFKTKVMWLRGSAHEFDVSPDGQRFLIGTLIGNGKAATATVILNWPASLKK